MVDACQHCHQGNLQGHSRNVVSIHMLEGTVKWWLMLPSKLQHSTFSGVPETQNPHP